MVADPSDDIWVERRASVRLIQGVSQGCASTLELELAIILKKLLEFSVSFAFLSIS